MRTSMAKPKARHTHSDIQLGMPHGFLFVTPETLTLFRCFNTALDARKQTVLAMATAEMLSEAEQINTEGLDIDERYSSV